MSRKAKTRSDSKSLKEGISPVWVGCELRAGGCGAVGNLAERQTFDDFAEYTSSHCECCPEEVDIN